MAPDVTLVSYEHNCDDVRKTNKAINDRRLRLSVVGYVSALEKAKWSRTLKCTT